MDGTMSSHSSMLSTLALDAHLDEKMYKNLTFYRSIVDSILYIIHTSPDNSYVVDKIC